MELGELSQDIRTDIQYNIHFNNTPDLVDIKKLLQSHIYRLVEINKINDHGGISYTIESLSSRPISMVITQDEVKFQYKTLRPNGLVLILHDELILRIVNTSGY
jgi:hypothetical protein